MPEGYEPNLLEFVLPLAILIGVAIGTFIMFGSPEVHWAFGAALIFASLVALAKGMTLRQLLQGYESGFKGVVMGSVISVACDHDRRLSVRALAAGHTSWTCLVTHCRISCFP